MKHADRIGARYVAIVGDDGVSLKDMETGEQSETDPDTVIPTILRGSGLS